MSFREFVTSLKNSDLADDDGIKMTYAPTHSVSGDVIGCYPFLASRFSEQALIRRTCETHCHARSDGKIEI